MNPPAERNTDCYPEISFELVEPRAASLVESLRAFGYDLGSAIADLVDNSISAGSSNVWIDFQWQGAESTISLTDDGRGMSEETLRSAMRLGSRHPSDPREAQDLGRFGLGLKTASFSQSRCVSVLTKKSNLNPVLRRWDLDHLAKTDAWQVLLEPRQGSENNFRRLSDLTSGTCVLWQDLDRVSGVSREGSDKNRDVFISQCEEVERHLALIFHRLLQGAHLQLFVNDHPIKPIDPFFVSDATQILQEHHLKGGILVEPFVMPHESKLPDSEARAWAGDSRDWVARQGFYIYRQDRLLVAGSWLGFRGWRKDEHHKLARIRISLTNSSDEEWQIDVTKRKASPPEFLRESLQRIGQRTRDRAKRVYTFRGTRLTSGNPHELKFVWEQVIRHGQASYLINRNHPLVLALTASGNKIREVNALLKLVEETLPTLLIAAGGPEHEKSSQTPPVGSDQAGIKVMLLQAWNALRDSGLDHADAMICLAGWEPFNVHPALLAEVEANPPYR
jgi:Histidine kinase-, DNA gyrase B-, and HSP90-like ATPase